MTRRAENGSTLIELLISLSILGVILLIILGGFRIGIRAWETGDRDVDQAQRLQMVVSILKRQLSSASGQTIAVEDEAPFMFRGDAASMTFVSAVSVVPGNEAGNARVEYRVAPEDEADGYALEIMEQPFLGKGKKTDGDKEVQAHLLLSGAEEIRFEYLRITPEEALWQTEWYLENEDKGFPAAVRCVLRMDAKTPPVTVIARLPVLADNAE